jgi:hypothetical protein
MFQVKISFKNYQHPQEWMLKIWERYIHERMIIVMKN